MTFFEVESTPLAPLWLLQAPSLLIPEFSLVDKYLDGLCLSEPIPLAPTPNNSLFLRLEKGRIGEVEGLVSRLQRVVPGAVVKVVPATIFFGDSLNPFFFK